MSVSTCSNGLLDIEQEPDRFVMRTDVARLLAWGRKPTASNVANTERLRARLASLHTDTERSFYGMGGASVLSLCSWPDGLALAERYRRELPQLPPLPSVARVPAWGEDGDEFDRDRFDAGVDECWRTRRRARRPGRPVLRLTCEVGGNCNLRAEQLVWSGAVASAVCDVAESAGWRIEVQAVAATSGSFVARGVPNDLAQVINVKDAADPLDLATVVMALACPAFFRWYMIHSAVAVTPHGRVDTNFGSSVPVPKTFHGDLHIAHCYSADAAGSELRRLVARLAAMSEGAADAA